MNKSWAFKLFLRILIPICFLLVLLLTSKAYSLDRCQDFVTDVRSEHVKQFGYAYPWATGMGVMKQESSCRPDVVSFDGGIGLYQFTPNTGILASLEKKTGFKFNPSNPIQSIHAYVLYIQQLINSMKNKTGKAGSHIAHPKEYTDKCGLKLSTVFTAYNGGWWMIFEWEKGGKDCDRDHIRKFCTRGGATVGGRYISFCDINYRYAIQVADYSKKYGSIENDKWRFW